MPATKGQPRSPGAGRKPGTPNRLTKSARECFIAKKYDPLIAMIEDARRLDPGPERAKINQQLIPYMHPKLSTVEHVGEGGGPLTVTINYGTET